MKEWILLKNGIEIKRSMFPDNYTWEGRKVDSDLKWLEIIKNVYPKYNAKTQRLVKSEGIIDGKWVISQTVVDIPQKPEYDSKTEKIITSIVDVDGYAEKRYEVVVLSQEEINNIRKQEINVEIKNIDDKRIRLISDHILGVSTAKIKNVTKAPKSFLQDLEDEANALRMELESL